MSSTIKEFVTDNIESDSYGSPQKKEIPKNKKKIQKSKRKNKKEKTISSKKKNQKNKIENKILPLKNKNSILKNKLTEYNKNINKSLKDKHNIFISENIKNNTNKTEKGIISKLLDIINSLYQNV